jgi:chorismate mutase
MYLRGVRGAIDVKENTPDAILAATRRLLQHMANANRVEMEDLASVIFTATPDLDAVYPAHAARELGLIHVPLLCTQEMNVKDSLPRCIRVLMHWNTDTPPDQIRHVYLGRARSLRPDLVEEMDS